MASDPRTVAYLVEQMGDAGTIRSRLMFGEYGLYCDDRFVAMVCGDECFVKASAIASQFLDDRHLAPPYPGAKDAYRVPAERWDDRVWLGAFVRATTDALPPPKPKARTGAKTSRR